MPPRPVRIGLYSDSTMIGGAERSLLHLIASYRGDGRLVTIARSPDLLDAACAASHLVEPVLFVPVGGFAASVDRHRRLFASLDLDLVQVTLTHSFACLPALMGAIARRVPTVAVEQLVVPSRRLRGAVLKHSISRLLAGHVAVGHRSKEDLHRWFRVPRRSIDVIHNGVPERPAVGRRAATRLTVGCAARFEDQKQLDVLVRAMVAVPSADLVLIGDGSQRSSLEALVTTLGMTERVTITGWRPDARTLIESLDLFVLPSRNESFPLTIVEAMFASVPVIATDVGSVRDAVVHEETGLVVGAGDVDALARAIATLVSDEARRHRLGSAGRERALRLFTVDAMAAKYEAVWDRALRSGNVMRTG